MVKQQLQRGEQTQILRRYLKSYPDLSPAELVQKIKQEHGLDVNLKSIYNTKSNMNRKPPKQQNNSPLGQKSEIVREYIRQYPDLSVKEALIRIKKEKGIDINNAMYYSIRKQMTASPNKTQSNKAEPIVADWQHLARIAKLVKDAGGFKELRAQIKIIEDMQVSSDSQ